MMEAVKVGQLDLIDALLRAGARLDVQDVNGDTVLHWSSREVSAAFLRQVLQLARRHGATTSQLLEALQLKNNSGETAADVGANDIARESIQRLLTGEETPGWALKNSNCIVQRPSNTVVSGASGSGSGSGTTLPPSKVGQQKPRTAPTVATGGQGLHSQIAPSLTGLPRGGTVGAMAGATPEFPAAGGTAAVATMAEA
ncbi:unnamed protein product, partial [Sphacelaria rigidula]